jgi:hypothetical protein
VSYSGPDIIAIAKAHLQRDVPGLCRELGLEGRPRGKVLATRNPARADRHGGSFVVWVKGANPGCWKDYATGDAGDVLALVAHCRGTDMRGALDWALDRYGLRQMSAAERRRRDAEARAARARAERLERESRDRDRRKANLTFSRALPGLSATVRRYLASRGLPIPDGFEARWFRSFEAYEWWPGRDRETGEGGPLYPCMVAGFVDGGGRHVANHFTFLSPDGDGKAPVSKPKLMWPAMTGAVIRVTRGETGLDPEAAVKAGKRGPVVITEGIEDALTLANAAPECRIWCAGSLPNYAALVDHACVSGWVIARDNDWGKPQAAALFERATERLRGFGKPVRVIASTSGKDFNDQWRGA